MILFTLYFMYIIFIQKTLIQVFIKSSADLCQRILFFLTFNFETITLNSQSLHTSADFSSFLFWVCFCLCKKIPYKTPHPPLEAFVLCFIFLFTIVTQSLYPRDAASCQHIIDTSIFKWILTSNMLPQVGVSPCGIFNI